MRYWAKRYWPVSYWPRAYWAGAETGGYAVYRGAGGRQSVDYATELSRCVGATITLTGLGHAPGGKYWYAVRPLRNGLVCPDRSCAVELSVDSGGDWEGNRPAAVGWAECRILPAGVLRLRWRYDVSPGAAAAEDFAVWHGPGMDLGAGSPDHVEPCTGEGYYEHDFTLAGGESHYFRIVARTAGGVESSPLTVGPFLADAAAPPAPAMHVSRRF